MRKAWGVERTRRTKRAGLVALLGLTAVLVSGCSTAEVVRFGWPEGITPQAERMRELWSWSVITALAVGVVVWGLIFWTTTFHRKKEGAPEFPRQTQYNLPLEIVYTIIPFLMVAVLFYFTVITQNFVDKKIANPDVEVNVTAFQWNWDFSYPGHTTPDGQDVSTIGSSTEIPLLVVPTNKTVQFTLSSQDVIHGFYIPEMLFKRDVFPRPERNDTDNVFQVQVEKQGAFVGRCTEMCGQYHSMMNFELRAVPDDVYQQYLSLRTTMNPATAAPYTAAEALTKINCGDLCSPVATTTHPFNTDTTARSASVAEGQ
ncbi:cytochrome c oxidase subunit II [Rhodococcus antarcticus]|jgi:cytochrome c oxidase subunit 2|uniref:Cytochrome c oxidase subunit 2 n=1 Tax=Rhodococcus antarcticus TaxID=2987751 RepID=A0ABY6P4L6_9NOCA|nr:cytochrome c oxidase subunit II [Rhodococcus antarcticus]UZJ26617.1 cytochrome c oxidase subunit II [Rhodococcus antarcticus]